MTLYDIRHLSFAYGDRQIIRDLSLVMEEGVFYGILGPNGSGKTTLLDLLTRHLPPRGGTIYFQGLPLTQYSRKALAREIALVSQNFYINFPYTVEEVVCMGRHPYIGRFSSMTSSDWEMVETVMERVGVTPFRHRYITELSGGERQRVVVARAVCQDTPVLILDEATSNLDVRHALALLSEMRQRVDTENRTVISVFQDINLALLYCDRLVVLDQGKLAACGDIQSVMTEEMLARVFGVSARVYDDDFSGALQVVFGGRRV